MNKPNYTKEELDFIKKWGIPCDMDFDTKRTAYVSTKDERITALFLAQQRKRFLERHGKISKQQQ